MPQFIILCTLLSYNKMRKFKSFYWNERNFQSRHHFNLKCGKPSSTRCFCAALGTVGVTTSKQGWLWSLGRAGSASFRATESEFSSHLHCPVTATWAGHLTSLPLICRAWRNTICAITRARTFGPPRTECSINEFLLYLFTESNGEHSHQGSWKCLT